MTKLSKEDFYKKFVSMEVTEGAQWEEISNYPSQIWNYCEAYAEQSVDEERERKHKEEVKDRFLGLLMVVIVSGGISILIQVFL